MPIHSDRLILYHADCDNRFDAAHAAWLTLGGGAEYQPVHYGACFIKGDDAICSLRSLAPFDVSVIATHFGGGGHPQASGFALPIDRFLSEIWCT